jgi:8-oxo-dGTP pyrophosphatase MutT (NUDIX family)
MESPPPVADEAAELHVVHAETVFHGRVWDVRRDTVDLGDGRQVTRELIVHYGAVGVIALNDADEVLLLRQYRHPVSAYLWEPPAGLLDIPGEDALRCAKRELFEEADLRADEWHVLLDFYNSPGGNDESFRCYLARGLHDVPATEQHEREDEERDMTRAWLPLDEARDLVLAGKLHNPASVAGILAASAARTLGWDTLRHADAPWPERSPGR